ncbi:hypothetical protein ACEV75_24420, partial [Vibrio parahaemolyticus]
AMRQSGYYDSTLVGSNGCDSFLTLHLVVNQSSRFDTIRASICYNATYPFNGQALSQSGTYRDTVTSAHGC